MEVLTIEHSAFQQLISKIDAMDEFIRKAKLEQQSSLDDDWVDGQAVCEYLCICDKTLQRLRSAGKITYSTLGNKYYYQNFGIKLFTKSWVLCRKIIIFGIGKHD